LDVYGACVRQRVETELDRARKAADEARLYWHAGADQSRAASLALIDGLLNTPMHLTNVFTLSIRASQRRPA
jgi:hypothetical protein